ncbi:MAG: hypothetical protein H7319_02890 [Spirosoma sp.]|nr:hypothetical protein [Spirosoma sp.]
MIAGIFFRTIRQYPIMKAGFMKASGLGGVSGQIAGMKRLYPIQAKDFSGYRLSVYRPSN